MVANVVVAHQIYELMLNLQMQGNVSAVHEIYMKMHKFLQNACFLFVVANRCVH